MRKKKKQKSEKKKLLHKAYMGPSILVVIDLKVSDHRVKHTNITKR